MVVVVVEKQDRIEGEQVAVTVLAERCFVGEFIGVREGTRAPVVCSGV